MKFHHLGVAVADMVRAKSVSLALLDYIVELSATDPIQRAEITMLYAENHPRLELIMPLADDSPTMPLLRRDIAAYHACYEVADLDGTIAGWQANGCKLVAGPMPAALFKGKRVAFFYLPTRQLVELLEE